MKVNETRLSKRLRGVLIEDERTKDLAFDVLDDNGVVTLSGTVPDDRSRRVAGEIVSRQEGVVKVINELQIRSDGEEGKKRLVVPPALYNQNT